MPEELEIIKQAKTGKKNYNRQQKMLKSKLDKIFQMFKENLSSLVYFNVFKSENILNSNLMHIQIKFTSMHINYFKKHIFLI